MVPHPSAPTSRGRRPVRRTRRIHCRERVEASAVPAKGGLHDQAHRAFPAVIALGISSRRHIGRYSGSARHSPCAPRRVPPETTQPAGAGGAKYVKLARPSTILSESEESVDTSVVFAGDLPAATLSDRVHRGQLVRLGAGVYTERCYVLIPPRWWLASGMRSSGRMFPRAVITDRSAVTGGPVDGVLYLSHDGRGREAELPGMTVTRAGWRRPAGRRHSASRWPLPGRQGTRPRGEHAAVSLPGRPAPPHPGPGRAGRLGRPAVPDRRSAAPCRVPGERRARR